VFVAPPALALTVTLVANNPEVDVTPGVRTLTLIAANPSVTLAALNNPTVGVTAPGDTRALLEV
jgi:hypothetical protein